MLGFMVEVKPWIVLIKSVNIYKYFGLEKKKKRKVWQQTYIYAITTTYTNLLFPKHTLVGHKLMLNCWEDKREKLIVLEFFNANNERLMVLSLKV